LPMFLSLFAFIYGYVFPSQSAALIYDAAFFAIVFDITLAIFDIPRRFAVHEGHTPFFAHDRYYMLRLFI
jgi:hypothetical protein